jgi:hypothetical protein
MRTKAQARADATRERNRRYRLAHRDEINLKRRAVAASRREAKLQAEKSFRATGSWSQAISKLEGA